MASQRWVLLPAIVITIYLDVLTIAATAAVVVWNPKTSRYISNYNLDKGPVFYEAYYPDNNDAHQEKRYFDRNTVLETSFQVPFEHIAYSETTDHPVTINESLVVIDKEETLPRKQQKTIESQRNYDAASQLTSFSNERSIFENDKNLRAANIEEISNLVRRAIFRNLENWNALEGYLDRTVHQNPLPQLEMYSKKFHKNEESDNYRFPVNRRFIEMDSSKPSSFETLLPQKLDARDRKRPIYFEGVDANENTMASKTSMSGTQTVDISSPIDVISDSSPPENIFQLRPQLIRYTFFKRPMSPRLEKDEAIDLSTPRTYGDNLIREEITDGNHGRRVGENVKVTSIEISKLPPHKTRHHHGEWSKRDYSVHRSQPATHPTIS